MKTLQETFDTVAAHLLRQNAKATTLNSFGIFTCAYRAPDGKKCAVGCLISDEEYTPELEFKSISDHEVLKSLPSIKEHSIEFLSQLQQIHDMNKPEMWRDELQFLASDHNLSIQILNTIPNEHQN